MLLEEKPFVPKSQIKENQKTKWTQAQFVLNSLSNLKPIMFEASRETPHIRTNNVDYWPATQRFYDRDLRKWGVGQDNYIQHVKIKVNNI